MHKCFSVVSSCRAAALVNVLLYGDPGTHQVHVTRCFCQTSRRGIPVTAQCLTPLTPLTLAAPWTEEHMLHCGKKTLLLVFATQLKCMQLELSLSSLDGLFVQEHKIHYTCVRSLIPSISPLPSSSPQWNFCLEHWWSGLHSTGHFRLVFQFHAPQHSPGMTCKWFRLEDD